jgi:hypothetical protein
MRAVVQRVSEASVEVEGEEVGRIDHGIMVLLGVGHEDAPKDAANLADKVVNLRIFGDEQGKMNRSLLDVGGLPFGETAARVGGLHLWLLRSPVKPKNYMRFLFNTPEVWA